MGKLAKVAMYAAKELAKEQERRRQAEEKERERMEKESELAAERAKERRLREGLKCSTSLYPTMAAFYLKPASA